MPLLPLEPFIFPETLLDSPPDASPDSAWWWALHTKPRAEKKLVRRFLDQGTSFFLPLYERQWRSGRRLQRSYLPLFPGYVFLRGDHHARLAALQTNLIVNCLPVADQAQLHQELGRVYRLMTSGVPLAPEDRLLPGTPVEVTHGPFAGLEGKVLRRGNHLRLFVEVQFIQRAVSVEVESWMVEPIGSLPLVPTS
jgi:transcriptional antiterminator RfaH